jgi:hypothetical protein
MPAPYMANITFIIRIFIIGKRRFQATVANEQHMIKYELKRDIEKHTHGT